MNDRELVALMQARGAHGHWDQPTAKDWVDVLASFPLLEGVSKRRLRKLARHATCVEFGPGETIISAGEGGNVLYLILAGDVRTVSTAARRTLGSGDYFGEVAMIDGGPRCAAVVAMSYVHVMKLPALSVLKLAHRHPAITLRMLADLTTRLRRLETYAARAA